ncbi:MAG: hypothetical protein JXA52_06700 [Planctomycetes bacterium]|nr:hypothetical protein [Planctomycetota bacterium]
MTKTNIKQPGKNPGRLTTALIFPATLITVFFICSRVEAAGRFSYQALQKSKTINYGLPSPRVSQKLPKFVPIVESALPEDVRLPRKHLGKWTDSYEETGMTFLEYVTSNPNRPSALRRTIYLVPIGRFSDQKSMAILQKFVSAYFLLPVKILPPTKLDKSFYDPSRKQYDADEILLQLHGEIPADAFVCTAIAREDIFSGRLSSVYGLSYSDLRTSIVSTSRIWQNPEYSKETDEQLRLAKLVVHEICHNLGLSHCAAHSCRMNGTMGLGDLERAPVTLCGSCLKKLQWNIGFDNTRRYRALELALREIDCPREAMVIRTRTLRRIAQSRTITQPRVIMAARNEDENLLDEF